MNRQEDSQLLSRYLDGELSINEQTLLKKRLLSETDLSREYNRLKSVNDLLLHHFNENTKSVPPRTAAMLGSVESKIVTMPHGANPIWQFATAATVVAAIGLFLVRGWGDFPAGQPVLFEQDQLLSQALDHATSSPTDWVGLADGRELRPILTFPHANGGWCREYELTTNIEHWKGVACRTKDTVWITQALGSQHAIEPIVDKYRPAGADENGEIGNFVKENASDIPISVARERILISKGWKE